MMLFIIGAQPNQKQSEEKTPHVIKEELIGLFMEIEDQDKPGLDAAVRNEKDSSKSSSDIKTFLKGRVRKLQKSLVKKGELLPLFRGGGGIFTSPSEFFS